MKQANHAPQSLWRRRLPGYAAMGAATLAMRLAWRLMHSRTTVAGTALPLADADAATYGVSAVYQLDDTTYYVVGSKQGFQSEVQAGVTLDRDGNVLDVKILAQAETDSWVPSVRTRSSRPSTRAQLPSRWQASATL